MYFIDNKGKCDKPFDENRDNTWCGVIKVINYNDFFGV